MKKILILLLFILCLCSCESLTTIDDPYYRNEIYIIHGRPYYHVRPHHYYPQYYYYRRR